jgi:polyphosphate glucokinase
VAKALGIDIGGTGIKGALVETDTGELLTERTKLLTPEGGKPKDVVATVIELITQIGGVDDDVPVGVCFPAVVKQGRTMSAANVSKKWIGLEAEALFEDALHRDIHFVNDADAAGYAEVRYGAAKDRDGLIMLTTLGTGIGTALIYNGVLVPNSELGHLEMNGKDAEKQAAYSVKEHESLDWAKWVKRLQQYYELLEMLFTPDLFIVGGGVSKHADNFLPLLELSTPIVPAVLRNNAGIMGAAALAVPGNPLKPHAPIAPTT